jgi:hypothetical protein
MDMRVRRSRRFEVMQVYKYRLISTNSSTYYLLNTTNSTPKRGDYWTIGKKLVRAKAMFAASCERISFTKTGLHLLMCCESILKFHKPTSYTHTC